MRCNGPCGELVNVYEAHVTWDGHIKFTPAAFTDPQKFVCVPCLDARYHDLYPQCRPQRPTNGPVDPTTMKIPF